MEATFQLQPTLTGSRIIVQPIKSQDWDEMFIAASNPEIWAVHPVSDRYTEPEFRRFFESGIKCGSAFSFVDRHSGMVVGSSRYYGYDPRSSEIEIGWTFLTKEYWGGSYNLEVKKLMLEHAFQFVDTVVFWVGEKNWRSQKAMEKIGGVLRADKQLRNLGVDSEAHLVYEIRKSNYIL